MAIIIRLQNLPWAADSLDIRRYFTGLSIPEGGVHIVGGEMGDAFIAFSTDEDARLAMAKDGGKIHEMQIKLLLSSRTEMMRVIERARQQNFALQAQSTPPINSPTPPALARPATESERKTARSQSPHHRGRRDRSPNGRDRHRSPDSRRSKRDRSRSPSRSSRISNRDTDRRGDRFKREDRRYDEDSRYRESERKSSRDQDCDSKKYSEANYQSSRQPEQQPARDSSNRGYYENSQSKDLPPAFAEKGQPSLVDTSVLDKIKVSLNKIVTTIPNPFPVQNMLYAGPKYDQNAAPAGQYAPIRMGSQCSERARVPHFDSEFTQPSNEAYFAPSESKTMPPAIQNVPSGNEHLNRLHEFQSNSSNTWPNQEHLRNARFHEVQPPNVELVNKSHLGDIIYSRPIPMDLEVPEHEATSQQETPMSMRGPSQSFKMKDKHRRHNIRDDANSRGVPQNDWKNSCPAVEIRGLPVDTVVGEVINLFPNSNISPLNICMVTNNQGVEKALVRLPNHAEFDAALNGPPRYIRNKRCLIIECPSEVFEATVAVQNSFKSRPKPKPREEDMVVQLRGLPYACNAEDLIRFFEGLRFSDLHITLLPSGKATGSAFVQLETPQDFRSALTLNGKMIGHRYITISVASKEMMAYAKGEEFVKPSHSDGSFNAPHRNDNERFPIRHPQEPPVNAPVEQRPPKAIGVPSAPHRQPFCLSLRNLPSQVNNDVLVNFFKDLNVKITAIHSLMTIDNRPSGDAYVEVASQKDADVALSGDGKIIFGNRVSIKQVPYHEIAKVLDVSAPYEESPPPPTPLLKTPNVPDVHSDKHRKTLIGSAPDEISFQNHPTMNFPYEEPHHEGYHPQEGPRPMMDFPRGERPRMPMNKRGERPRMERPPRMPFPRGDRPRMGERGPRMDPSMRGGRHPFGRMRGPPPSRQYRPSGPHDGKQGNIHEFGAPGCVVSINNLHFRAGLEELLDFFRGFKLSKDNIIRKFNDNDQATGEARVAFQNPWDAQRAVRELNQKPIMGRPLTLSVL